MKISVVLLFIFATIGCKANEGTKMCDESFSHSIVFSEKGVAIKITGFSMYSHCDYTDGENCSEKMLSVIREVLTPYIGNKVNLIWRISNNPDQKQNVDTWVQLMKANGMLVDYCIDTTKQPQDIFESFVHAEQSPLFNKDIGSQIDSVLNLHK